MSGGTALMLMMKAGVLRPSRLVNLRRLGLDQITLRAVYRKCPPGSAADWPAPGMAVVLDGQRASIALSAATDKPTRLAAAEKILSGSSLDDKLIQRAADAAREVRIEGDLHGSAAYKKHLIGVYLRRAIHEARNASR